MVIFIVFVMKMNTVKFMLEYMTIWLLIEDHGVTNIVKY